MAYFNGKDNQVIISDFAQYSIITNAIAPFAGTIRR